MLTFYDYLPSQNGWKIRQLLRHTGLPHRTEYVSIFQSEGQRPDYRRINPWGAVPAIRLDDGRVLSESNAILWYLGRDTPYRDQDPFQEAKILQWLSFEADYVQSSMGSLRYWTLTGKVPQRRPTALVDAKRAAGARALRILDEELAERPFIAGQSYSIADISIFAYAHLAPDAGLPLDAYPHFNAWVERVRRQPGHLAEMFPYSIDPHSQAELP
jgi:glutathione S-transferase